MSQENWISGAPIGRVPLKARRIEWYDVSANRLSGQDVYLQIQTLCLCELAGVLRDAMEAASGRALRFPYFFNEFWHLRNFFDADHMQLCAILLRKVHREFKCGGRMIRAIVSVENFAKHRLSPPFCLLRRP